MKNKDNFPTIEQSLKMIEERLKSGKKSKKINKNINEERKNKSLLNLFKEHTVEKKISYKT